MCGIFMPKGLALRGGQVQVVSLGKRINSKAVGARYSRPSQKCMLAA
jgi:hypothetical protein